MIKYSTLDEAISIANSTDYGLGGSVWGQDPKLLNSVARRMEEAYPVDSGSAICSV